MYCQKCGNKSQDGMLFCSKCGGRFAADTTDANEITVRTTNDDTIALKPIPKYNNDHRNDAARHNKDTESKNNLKIAIIVLSVCLAVVMIVLIVFGIKIFSSKPVDKMPQEHTATGTDNDSNTDKTHKKHEKSDDDSDDAEDKDDNDDDDDDDDDDNKPHSYSTIPIDITYASTARTEDGITFDAPNICDSKISTAWSPSTYDGVGDSVTLCFNKTRKIHGLRIANGYLKSADDYYSYGRAKRLNITFSNGRSYYFDLSDGNMDLQNIDFDDEIVCQSIEVKIESVYSGSVSQAVYISEIEVY